MAAAEFNALEALVVALLSTFIQCLPRGGQRFNLVQAAFNCSALMLAVAATRLIYTAPAIVGAAPSPALRLTIAAAGYCITNTVTVAIVIRLTEKANVFKTWLEVVQLSFPYLVASAAIAGLSLTINQEIGWQAPLMVLLVMTGIFLSYRRFFATTVPAPESLEAEAGSIARAQAHV
jgi:hypothetical protein